MNFFFKKKFYHIFCCIFFLSAIITYENFDNVLLSVKNYVQLHSGPVIWVPSALSTLPGVQCLTSTPKINYHSIVSDPINHPQHNNINANTTTNDNNNISALQSLSIQSVNSTQ